MNDLTKPSRNKCLKYALLALVAAALVGIGFLLREIDFDILYFIQDNLRNGFFDTVVPLYTTLGEWAICWIVIGLVMLIFKKTRKCGFWTLVSLLAVMLICNIAIKNLVARPRPCYLIDPEVWNAMKLVGDPSEYSFPSGHSVSSMASALTIYFHHKKLGIAAIVAALLMGLSRLYVFVHFPTDVWGGFLIGAAIALAVRFAELKITAYREKRSTSAQAN